jgi:hypothetical protein
MVIYRAAVRNRGISGQAVKAQVRHLKPQRAGYDVWLW